MKKPEVSVHPDSDEIVITFDAAAARKVRLILDREGAHSMIEQLFAAIKLLDETPKK